MQFRISLHAVERYVDRIDPTASFAAARAAIREAFTTASRQREPSRSGDAYYLADRMRLIVAEENGSRTVLTVLPPAGDHQGDDIPEQARLLAQQFEEWEATQRHGRGELGDLRKQAEVLQKALAARKKEIANLQAKLNRTAATQPPTRADVVPLTQLESVKRKLEKQAAHAARMVEDRDSQRRLIRPLVAAVLAWDREMAEQSLDMIRAAQPGLVEAIEASSREAC